MNAKNLFAWLGISIPLVFGGTTALAQTSPGTFSFGANSYSVAENGATAAITVQRTGGSDGTVSVDFGTADGSAIGGLDYIPQSGTLVFASGETSQTFTVLIIDDLLADGNKTVNLTLANPTGGAVLGVPFTAVLTIVDDDVTHPGALSFSAGTYSVTENGATATITVQRTGGSDGAVSVDFGTADGSAIGGLDYIQQVGTLVFAPGETSQTFTVPIIDDLLTEGNETVNLALSNPTGGATLGVPSTAVLTIVDDDVAHPGVLGFSTDAYSVAENGVTATITILRTGGSDGAVSVNFTTAAGSAADGLDFIGQSGVLTFAPGETSRTITVPILDDLLTEGNETVNLVLSNPTGGATLGAPSTAVLTIVDDDVAHPGVLGFSTDAYNVAENGVTATITVLRTGGSDGSVSVNFTTAAGSAADGLDFIGQSGVLTFAPGETSRTITVPIVDDLLPEGNETVNLALSNPTGGAMLGTPSTAVLTIVDNDAPRTLKQQVLAELTALRATVTNKDDGKKLDDAIEHLTKSLDAERWVDASHLQRKHGEKVFDEEKHAVKKLCELIKNNRSKLPAAVLQDFINRMFRADHQLASIAIAEAVAAGVAQKKIEQARKDLAKGDAETGDAKCENGIEDYKHAWKHVARAKLSAPAPHSKGKLRLELAGEPGEQVTVQASTNLLDWVTIGTWTIGPDGTATAEDAEAGKHSARYYRLVTP